LDERDVRAGLMATVVDVDEIVDGVNSSNVELTVRSLSMMAYGSLNSVPRFRAKSRPSSSLSAQSHSYISNMYVFNSRYTIQRFVYFRYASHGVQ